MVKTLSPQTYDEIFYVGDWFRCGTPVVMDLTAFDEDEAVRLVDFATGLVIGCGGEIERIAPRLFLLLPEAMVAAGKAASTAYPAPLP
jgi:cell division inhibitor SepF